MRLFETLCLCWRMKFCNSSVFQALQALLGRTRLCQALPGLRPESSLHPQSYLNWFRVSVRVFGFRVSGVRNQVDESVSGFGFRLSRAETNSRRFSPDHVSPKGGDWPTVRGACPEPRLVECSACSRCFAAVTTHYIDNAMNICSVHSESDTTFEKIKKHHRKGRRP